jgi:hypothetical protein
VLGGEFLAAYAGKTFESKDGSHHEPWKVQLLTSSGQMTVEYDSREEALGAVGAADGEFPIRLTRLTLPVYVQGGWDAAAGKRGPVFLRGRRMREEFMVG